MTLKFESYVLFCILQARKTGLSDISEGLFQRGKRGREGVARIYRNFCNKDLVVGTSNDYSYLKKSRHLKLMKLAGFYVWEDAKSRFVEMICTSAT